MIPNGGDITARLMTMARLPEFKTPEEFAEFFETHSVADYWEEFEEVTDIEFVRPAEAQAMIPLAVSDSLFKEMQAYATQEGVSLPALARRWLMAHARELQQARS